MKDFKPFFIIKADDSYFVAKFSTMIAVATNKMDPRFEIDDRPAQKRLNIKFDILNPSEAVEIPLDKKETKALENVFVITSYRVNGFFKLNYDPINAPFGTEEDYELFSFLKTGIPILLWEITKALDFSEYGLYVLEDVYDFKANIVKSLKVDDQLLVASIIITKENKKVYNVIFSTINTLEHFKEESEFIKRFYENEFMNIKDYRPLARRFLKPKIGEELHLTRKENIILYWSIAFSQRIFITDAADIIESLDENLFKQFRSILIPINNKFIEEMNKSWEHDEEMMKYFEMVKNWKI